MNEPQIRLRLDALTAAAKERRLLSDPFHMPGSDIEYMTSEEKAERHSLMNRLPSFGEQRMTARERIRSRIAARKRGIVCVESGAA